MEASRRWQLFEDRLYDELMKIDIKKLKGDSAWVTYAVLQPTFTPKSTISIKGFRRVILPLKA